MARSMASSGAPGRRRTDGTIDQIAHARRRAEDRSRFAPPYRQRLERRRARRDGAAAMPLPVPVPCRRRAALLPALSALRRYFSRRAFQHRLLRAADADGGAGDRAYSPANSFTPSATRIFTSTISTRPTCSSTASPGPCRAWRSIPMSARCSISSMRISARRLRPASRHQGRGRRVMRGECESDRRAGRRRRRERRDRAGGTPALAHLHRNEAFPPGDDGQAGHHGPEDIRLAQAARPKARQHRADP